MNETTLSEALVNMKKINNNARLTSQWKSRTLYSFQRKTYSNDEYECDKYLESQLQEITNALEKTLNNDTNEKEKISKQ